MRALTNVAEELRFLQPGEGPGERQAVLEEYLNGVPLPPMTFYPLQHSSERMAQILRFAPGEGVVFNTKARCPLMLFLEVKELKQSVAEALKTNALPEPDAAPVVHTANGAANGGSSDSGLSVGDRKREEWRARWSVWARSRSCGARRGGRSSRSSSSRMTTCARRSS